MINDYSTGFVETEALLAAQERDSETMQAHVAALSRAELRMLAYAAETLAFACREQLGRPQ